MMNDESQNNSIVFIVDDDNAVRESLRWLVESIGLHVLTFESAMDFLNSYNKICNQFQSSCLISDIRMKNMSGLELQTQLHNQSIHLPIIFITGFGDVSMAVNAMKAGAVDFFTKPVNDQKLLDCIQKTLSLEYNQERDRAHHENIHQRINTLSPREKEVLNKVVEGKLNKIIAIELNISNKTVEAHRAKVMEKMAAHTIADLVRMIVKIE